MMKRMNDSRRVLVVIAFCLAVAWNASVEAAQRVPNVIIIYADDLGYGDLGSYGCEYIPTPNIDQLAADGVRFADGYVSAPQCAPSRVGLLSGKYQNRLGYEYNVPRDDPEYAGLGFPAEEKTIGDLMKARGYTTGIIGKWHMGLNPDLHPNKRGFDEFFPAQAGLQFHEVTQPHPADHSARLDRAVGDFRP